MDMTLLTISDQLTEDVSWLASQHGTDALEPVSLDIALFMALGSGVKDQWLTGPGASTTGVPTVTYDRVRSGVPLGQVSATGAYGPYDDAATDGRQTLKGLLFGDGRFSKPTAIVAGSLFWHGMVREAALPAAVDAAGKADVAGRMRFV